MNMLKAARRAQLDLKALSDQEDTKERQVNISLYSVYKGGPKESTLLFGITIGFCQSNLVCKSLFLRSFNSVYDSIASIQ